METKTEPTTATPTSTIVKKQPNVDTRFKTEDVTDRKGLEFKDFKLCEELNLVSAKINFNQYSPCPRAFTKWASSSPPIQEEAIPAALDGRNILAKAKNGTGKTAAYSIPLIQRVDPKINKI